MVNGQTNWNGTHVTDGDVSGIIGFVGLPGRGKSYRAGKLIRRSKRVVIVDPKHTYCVPGRGTERQNPLSGFVFFSDVLALGRYLAKYKNGRGSFHVCFQPSGVMPSFEQQRKQKYRVERDFYDVACLVIALRDTVLVCDEVWMVCRAGDWPWPLQEIARSGRHTGTSLLWTAQAPQAVTYQLRAVTTRWFCFGLSGRHCLDAVSEFLPDAAVERLPALPPRHYIEALEDHSWQHVKG